MLRRQIKKKFTILTAIISVAISFAVIISQNWISINSAPQKLPTCSLTPWQVLGGTGTGQDASLDWLSNDDSKAKLEFQIMPTISAVSKLAGSGSSRNMAITLPISMTLNFPTSSIGLIIPFKSTMVNMNSKFLFGPTTVSTSGFGDIKVLLEKSFGPQNLISISSGFSLPTGRDDIWVDHDSDPILVAPNGQMGTGVLSTVLGISLKKMNQKSMYLFGIDYTAGLFFKEATEFTMDEIDAHHTTQKSKFQFARKNNDGFTYKNQFNTISSDTLGLKSIIAFKQSNLTHSFHAKFNIPMNAHNSTSEWNYIDQDYNDSITTWEEAQEFFRTHEFDNENVSKGEVIIEHGEDTLKSWTCFYPDTTVYYKVWPSLTLGYGMEIASKYVPFFWAVSFPIIFDMDRKVGFNGFSIQAGVKFGAIK